MICLSAPFSQFMAVGSELCNYILLDKTHIKTSSKLDEAN